MELEKTPTPFSINMNYIYNADVSALKQKGIYKISFDNYGFYIGKTIRSFRERWNEHITSFRKSSCNRLIQCLCNLDIMITFSIIKFLDSEIEEWESYFIYTLGPNLNIQHPKCYGNNPRCT